MTIPALNPDITHFTPLKIVSIPNQNRFLVLGEGKLLNESSMMIAIINNQVTHL